MFKTKKQKTLSLIIFGIYLFFLIWLILFKLSINLNNLNYIRNINLIPFHSSLMINGRISLREIVYNILVFIPLGVYISILKPNWSFAKKIIPCLFLSLSLEILQFLFAIGASDITDIIDNTLGGMIGVILFSLFYNIFKNKSVTIINTIGLIIEIFALLLLGILFISNM